jgi:hypothetical protein
VDDANDGGLAVGKYWHSSYVFLASWRLRNRFPVPSKLEANVFWARESHVPGCRQDTESPTLTGRETD